MNIDKGKLFHCWDDLCSMVFSDLIEIVCNLLKDGKLSKRALTELLGISVTDLDKILYNELPNITLKTYLHIIVLQSLVMDSSDKSNYDKVENKLQEKKNAFLDALKECKPDSKYLQQLRELAKANAGNEKLCELIRYYTE